MRFPRAMPCWICSLFNIYTSPSTTQLKRLLVGSTLKAVSVCIRMIFSASLIPYLKPLSIVRSVISEYLGHFLSVSLDET